MTMASDWIMCDGCGCQTSNPTWCDHGRVSCSRCATEPACLTCRREARDEASGR